MKKIHRLCLRFFRNVVFRFFIGLYKNDLNKVTQTNQDLKQNIQKHCPIILYFSLLNPADTLGYSTRYALVMGAGLRPS